MTQNFDIFCIKQFMRQSRQKQPKEVTDENQTIIFCFFLLKVFLFQQSFLRIQNLEPFNYIYFPLQLKIRNISYSINLTTYQMDLLKSKINFTQLTELITQWCQHPEMPFKKKSLHRHFKFQLNKTQAAISQIIHYALQYVYLVKFSNTLTESQQSIMQKQVILSAFLKQFYHKKIVSQQWTKQFSFQLSLVYIVELISYFLNQNFSSLKLNQTLKSQIYIVLIHVFLGIKVGTKTYFLTSKKYKVKVNKNGNNLQLKKLILKSQSSAKKSSISLSIKNSQKTINELKNSKVLRRNRTKQKISMISTQFKKSRLDKFTEQLKQSLFVDPLPPIEIKQMSILQYDRLNIYNDTQIKSQLQNAKKISQEMKRKHINSLTISASLDIEMKKQNGRSVQRLKSSNLSFKPQHHSKHYQNYLLKKDAKYEPIKTQIEHKPAKSKSKKNQHEEWREIIRRMKINANKPIQLLNTSSNSSKQNKENIEFQELLQLKQKNISCTKHKTQKLPQSSQLSIQTHKKVKTESNQSVAPLQRLSGILSMNIIQSTKAGKESLNQQIKNKIKEKFTQIKGQTQSYQSMLMKSGKLKLKKIQFLKQCKNRTQTIQHSAFDLKHKIVI